MKNKTAKIFLIFLIPSIVLSQDLIVTTTGDSIHCRITEVEEDFIHFTYMQGNEYHQTLIPTDNVKEYRKEYFDTILVPLDETGITDNGNLIRSRLSAGGGYQTGRIDPDLPSLLKEYMEELKLGYRLSGEFYIMRKEGFIFGGMLSVFKTRNEISLLAVKDDITVLYAGPAAQVEIRSGNNYTLYTASSLGYLNYHNKAMVDWIDYNFKGSTLGWLSTLRLDLYLDANYGITLGIDYLWGYLTKFTMTWDGESETVELEHGNYEDLSRLDINVGFYFQFGQK